MRRIEGSTSGVKVLITGCLSLLEYIYISCEVCCFYGCLVYHNLLDSFGSVLYHCIYGCMICMLLFNFVNYVFLLLHMFCVLFHWVVLCIVCMHYCHWMSTQLRVTNISFHNMGKDRNDCHFTWTSYARQVKDDDPRCLTL
jgi:hypothetical protein